MTFGPKKQSDWSGREAFTAARSGSVSEIFFAISRPCPGSVKTSSRFSGAFSRPRNTSRRNASCPFSSNVLQIPAAEARETSRSVLSQPANTIIFMMISYLIYLLHLTVLLLCHRASGTNPHKLCVDIRAVLSHPRESLFPVCNMLRSP